MGHDDVSLSIVLGFCCFFFLFHIILSLYCSHISRILIDTLNALSKSVFLLFPFLIKSDETIFDSKCIGQSFYMHIRYLMRFVYRKPICKTCFSLRVFYAVYSCFSIAFYGFNTRRVFGRCKLCDFHKVNTNAGCVLAIVSEWYMRSWTAGNIFSYFPANLTGIWNKEEA